MPDPRLTQPSRRLINPDRNLYWLIALMFTITVLSLVIYDRLRYRPIMTVDIEAILQHKLDQLQQQNSGVNQDEMVQLSQQWAQQLASEVATLTTEYNAVVLVRPAVIQGSIDMTGPLLTRLSGTAP